MNEAEFWYDLALEAHSKPEHVLFYGHMFAACTHRRCVEANHRIELMRATAMPDDLDARIVLTLDCITETDPATIEAMVRQVDEYGKRIVANRLPWGLVNSKVEVQYAKEGVIEENGGYVAYVKGRLVAAGPDKPIIEAAYNHHKEIQ